MAKKTINTTKYEAMTAQELKDLAKAQKVKNWWTLKKAELIEALAAMEAVEEVAEKVKSSTEKKGAKKEAPAKKEKKEPKPDSENIITLKELAVSHGVKGSKARRLLREAGIERPFKRWEWDQDEHHDIITQVVTLLGGGQEE